MCCTIWNLFIILLLLHSLLYTGASLLLLLLYLFFSTYFITTHLVCSEKNNNFVIYSECCNVDLNQIVSYLLGVLNCPRELVGGVLHPCGNEGKTNEVLNIYSGTHQ